MTDLFWPTYYMAIKTTISFILCIVLYVLYMSMTLVVEYQYLKNFYVKMTRFEGNLALF